MAKNLTLVAEAREGSLARAQQNVVATSEPDAAAVVDAAPADATTNAASTDAILNPFPTTC